MTLRTCIYKNCGNYINLKDRSVTDVKLFTFPKNPERRQKWMELGRVPPNLPETAYYFCSDHFDRKFMAINNRRTLLVGEAIPFPYIETEIDISCEDADGNLDYCLYEINNGNIADKQDVLDGQDIHVESTTMTSEMKDNFSEEQLPNHLDDQEPDECVIFTEEENYNLESSVTYGNKRKLESATSFRIDAGLSKSKIVKTSPSTNIRSLQMSHIKASALSPTSRTASKDTNIYELERDQMIDRQCVTTFIYKGEEFVQMPKEYYVNEKLEATKKLRKMEKAFKAIRDHLNSIDV